MISPTQAQLRGNKQHSQETDVHAQVGFKPATDTRPTQLGHLGGWSLYHQVSFWCQRIDVFFRSKAGCNQREKFLAPVEEPRFFHSPNILLSTPFSNTLSLCSCLKRETRFHTHKNNRQIYSSVYLNLYIFG